MWDFRGLGGWARWWGWMGGERFEGWGGKGVIGLSEVTTTKNRFIMLSRRRRSAADGTDNELIARNTTIPSKWERRSSPRPS